MKGVWCGTEVEGVKQGNNTPCGFREASWLSVRNRSHESKVPDAV